MAHPDKPTQLRRLLPLLLPFLAGMTSLHFVWHWDPASSVQPIGFPLDDAWIHMVYAREVAHTGILAYNPGVPATGATSPLWVGVLALVHLGTGGSIDAVIVRTYVAGSFFFLAEIILTALLVSTLTRSRWIGAAAGVALAASPSMAAASFSGMEIHLCASLLLGAVLAFIDKRFWLSGIAAALACAARPEAGAVVVLLAVAMFAFREDKRRLLALLVPSVVVALAWGLFDLHATGRLLPATFYMKQEVSEADLLHRISIGVTNIVEQIAPFWWHLLWIGAAGLAIPARLKESGGRVILPFVAGAVFLVGNVAVVRPVDPAAFYHIRYLMPAVPLLVAGCTIGMTLLGRSLHWKPGVAAGMVVGLGVAGFLFTLPPVSAHLHNDIRNINEVQRAMGTWVGLHTGPSVWIAASDAGAVRYCSDRPTIDLMGLNTPEVMWNGDGWIKERPVKILAFMPSWFRPVDRKLGLLREFTTQNYSVTSAPVMATQIAAVCLADSSRDLVRLELTGMRHVAVYCVGISGLR